MFCSTIASRVLAVVRWWLWRERTRERPWAVAVFRSGGAVLLLGSAPGWDGWDWLPVCGEAKYPPYSGGQGMLGRGWWEREDTSGRAKRARQESRESGGTRRGWQKRDWGGGEKGAWRHGEESQPGRRQQGGGSREAVVGRLEGTQGVGVSSNVTSTGVRITHVGRLRMDGAHRGVNQGDGARDIKCLR